MPTLVRLLSTIALLAGIVLAMMTALVYLVEPVPHRVVIDVPLTFPGDSAETVGENVPQ